MPAAIHTPRVNNNDDFVRFSRTFVEAGAAVKTGDPVAEIETDKATFTVESERDGYLLGFVQPLGEMIAVGSVLGWIGDLPGETIPNGHAAAAVPVTGAEPTLKAALLLAKFGMSAASVPASGARLSAQDVMDYAAKRPSAELSPGERHTLTAAERGMLRTVSWHGQQAVPGYVEIEYPAAPWDRYAEAFQSKHKLLLSPLLALMAWRLVELAKTNPKLNSTISGDERLQYAAINLGFTLQAAGNLYLLSVKDADTLEEKPFVDAMSLLMRQGMKGKLTASQTGGVTIGFSSMARWKVTRHMPILAPFTSLMVAHAQGPGPLATLGATYDHRVLTGGEVAAALQMLSSPPVGY